MHTTYICILFICMNMFTYNQMDLGLCKAYSLCKTIVLMSQSFVYIINII